MKIRKEFKSRCFGRVILERCLAIGVEGYSMFSLMPRSLRGFVFPS